jgi:hypothetical protein
MSLHLCNYPVYSILMKTFSLPSISSATIALDLAAWNIKPLPYFAGPPIPINTPIFQRNAFGDLNRMYSVS